MARPSCPLTPFDFALRASCWSLDEASRADAALTENPDEAELHASLIGYYSSRPGTTGDERRRMLVHVLWFVRVHPEDMLCGTPAFMWREGHADLSAEIADAWEANLRRPDASEEIYRHAALFFGPCSWERSEELLLAGRARAARPETFTISLGRLRLELAERSMSPTERGEHAARAVGYLSDLAASTPEEMIERRGARSDRRAYALRISVDSAWLAEDYELVRRGADLLVSPPPEGVDDVMWGHRHHVGWTWLGMLALNEEDTEAAKSALLESVRLDGSHILSSYGPRTALARALLERGERDAVRMFIEGVRAFRFDPDEIDAWLETLIAGGDPWASRMGDGPP